MKETFYFPHDYNSMQDSKMIHLLHKCGLEGIGSFWIIVELLHQQPDGKIPISVFENHIKMYHGINKSNENGYSNICSTLVEIGLFKKVDNYIVSDRVETNRKHRDLISHQRSIAGKASANKRLRTNVERSVEQNPTKERKGKERKYINDSDFVTSLKNNFAFKHLNIDAELGKMDAWCLANHKQKTRKFVVAWLNRIDKPLNIEIQEQKRKL